MSAPSSWAKAGNTVTTSAWAGEAESDQSSFSRLWRVFMTARVAIATVLVILQAVIHALGNITSQWSIAICIGYLFATIIVQLWARPRPPGRHFDARWLLTIGVDVFAFSSLNFLQSGGINYTPLFALPVLLSSVLGPILLAFGTAATVTLLLLADALWISTQGLGDLNARLLQSSLSGSGFFIIALLANQLALRLAREELLAKRSQSAARMQTQVNELVIDSLADGVLVVDAKGVVRSANPASRRLLATREAPHTVPFVLANETAWQSLAELASRTIATRFSQEADVNLKYLDGNGRMLHVRTRLAAAQGDTDENLCVMFLEDLREMEARVRTEKMAAMGRMSAAVAHEIRNPLAAIAQANALLEEDLIDPDHRQLTALVGQNAQRLAKIVDEVLNISRAQAQIPTSDSNTLLLDDSILRLSMEWAEHTGASGRIQVTADSGNSTVWFDPEHLRRLMINLLDNALRYTSTSNPIEVGTSLIVAGQARLSVWSDGQPLEKSVQSHLFEPFFSSESRSSGLGLYICRELCERYGAAIGYQRQLRAGIEGNEFFVAFRPTLGLLSTTRSFDTIIV